MANNRLTLNEYLELLVAVARPINDYLRLGDYDDALDNISWICDNANYLREMISDLAKEEG